MTGRTLRARERRTLVVGVTVIGALLLGGRGIPRLRAWEGAQLAALNESAAQAARLRATNATLVERTPGPLSVAREAAALRERCFVTPSRAEATSLMVQYITGLARFAGVETQVALPDAAIEEAANVGRIGMRLTLTGPSRGLFELLRELEVGPKLITVRRLHVTQSDPGAEPAAPESLRIELEIIGLFVRAADGGTS